MIAECKIKRYLLWQARQVSPTYFCELGSLQTDEEVRERYSFYRDDNEETSDTLSDLESEFRCSGEETELDPPSSRHYEACEVARQLPDGRYVGWTFWFGGGKHGQPESIEWMEDAYDLDCTEKEEMVVVKTFTKRASDENS